MSREEFIENLRRAVGLLHPNISVPEGMLDATSIAQRMTRAALWLTPKAVEGFSADEFPELPESELGRLREATCGFLKIANEVSTNGPVNDEQYNEGRRYFETIVEIVREFLLRDWQTNLEHLVGETQSWAEKRGWLCRRHQKQMKEKLLGNYEVPGLLIQADLMRLQLDPITRFVQGATGLVDLSVMPSYSSARLSRTDEGWSVDIPKGKDYASIAHRPWSEDAFTDAVETLRQRL